MTGPSAWVGGYRLPFITLGAVAGCAVLAPVTGARPAALLLAGVLATAAFVRAATRAPGPGIAIRSRWFDVAFLAGMSLVIATFAATTSGV
jgi:hypothetical protein